MKLLTFLQDGKEILGVKTDEGIINVTMAASAQLSNEIPIDVMEVIAGGEKAISAISNLINQLGSKSDYLVKEDNIEWAPVVTKPSKIICVGLNYRKHADETNSPYPEYPILFNKFNNTLTGNLQEIPIPKVTEKLDYEVELGIVIGKEVKEVTEDEALDFVFGYVTTNDLSARDLQFKTSQWLLGKSCDGFSPVGPYLVTHDEVGDPQKLNLKTVVNGKVRQDSSTADMIFSCKEIISFISQHMTLVPGDIILTGIPEGVIMGDLENQQVYLQPGDEVTVEVEKLGTLKNTFVVEQ
ncbi:fumarylacetoacetate hydrolase family protein [Virgibacillus doumboii]|uniref:fumarylacetoacetate hydrolase family protein n=1 Tax=Virgibacillus doumboii TaxID=2697503 RepID=UPI0013DFBC22|nr:fumarylacetoacetate hydrolase family protein [Virgibacillus doumboii]